MNFLTRPYAYVCRTGAAVLAACGILAGCGGGSDGPVVPPEPPTLVSVGEKLFLEVSLSASGKMSCATCHVEERGHADPVGTFLPLGGPLLNLQGFRSSPTARYLDATPVFQILGVGAARGGFFWDGRVDTRDAQARLPILSPVEMANPDLPSFIAKLRQVDFFGELLLVSGLSITASDSALLDAFARAVEAYQIGDEDFHPFTSKFDAVQAGTATFTAQEAQGLALFNNPAKGNCNACHSSGGVKPLFTNFRYFALGAPRSAAVANADPLFFDLGICGPRRTDIVGRPDLCGLFKTPTLRNVELTAPYFHNGFFNTLEEVVDFYATRDTHPERWYPTVASVVQKFNDLPAIYHPNVTNLAPFGQPLGAIPNLTPQDILDIAAFMRTLTDGWTP